MIVVDTSAFISLATVDALDAVCAAFAVRTTDTVIDELQTTREYDDGAGRAAEDILEKTGEFDIHAKERELRSSRIDAGEGSCALLANELEADFLITDDLRVLPEIVTATEAQVAISRFVLRALVTRGVFEQSAARAMVELMATDHGWLESPIYRRAIYFLK